MINIKLLKEICETAGAPGFENRVRSLVLKQIKNHVDHIEIDNMGNIIALKKGVDSSKSVMIGAHMRSISLITKAMMYSSSSPSEVGSPMRTQDGISTMSALRWATSVNQEPGPAQASQLLVKMHSTGES